MYDVHNGKLYLKKKFILKIVGQMLSAFLFLNNQSTKIFPRDIKDKNFIIWISNKHIKIKDFGLAYEINYSDECMSSLVVEE